jgi:hypothetical protein
VSSVLRKMDLIYLNAGLGSVFEGQVLMLLHEMQRHPEIDGIILLCGYGNKDEKSKIRQLVEVYKIETKLFKIYPNYPIFNWLYRRSIKRVFKNLLFNTNSIIHIRGEILAMLCVPQLTKKGIRNSNILVDIRGASFEETLEYSNLNSLLKKYKSNNSLIALKGLDQESYINVISGSLKTYIKNSGLKFNNLFIIPCLSGEAFIYNSNLRREIRSNLNLKDEECLFVFSSGGTALWQDNYSINSIADKGYKVLNLSPTKIIHPNIINLFVRYNEMPGYLSAADIALLVRDRSIVNQVASPVKFGEFVCSGLPVVANGTVEMITEYIKSSGHGLNVKNLEELSYEKILYLRSLSRESISNLGCSIFSVNKISKSYLSVYKKMIAVE